MRRRGFTLVELLVVISIIGLLVAILLPAVQQAREAGRSVACRNNIRQIGLAAQLFHDSHGVYPASGWTTTGPGNPAGKFVGWRPLILPYMEQNNLHQLYDFEIDWWVGTNAVSASVPVTVFRCPSVPVRDEIMTAIAKPPRPAISFQNPIAPTDYEAIMGVKPESINPHLSSPFYNSSNRYSVMYRNSRTRIADVMDGTSNTVIITECGARPTVYRRRRVEMSAANDQGIGWADSEGPFSLDGASSTGMLEGCGLVGGCTVGINARNDNEPYSFHPSGAYLLYVDGHSAMATESMELSVLAAICTMNAGEISFPTN